ncbi:MAG TPA: hypothetical protein VJ742_13200 [Nitrososphaera sp.]|nr:hypothetical protein [Nitrososphaera sp.]
MENVLESDMSPDERTYESELWKKWTKAGGISRFLALRFWRTAGKFSIDIGESGDDGLRGSTKVFANAVSLATFLKAVQSGQHLELYPEDERAKLPAGAYMYYGGTQVGGKDISRILKIVHWQVGGTPDPNSFAWKAGHFPARRPTTGAYIPDLSNPLSQHSIKVTRTDMAELSTLLNLALVQHAASTRDAETWVKEITGKSR